MKNQVSKVALDLAIKFTEDILIPTRYKKTTSKKIRDSQIENKFNQIITKWESLIEIMYDYLGFEQTNRFIKLSPRIESDVRLVTECQDFLDFTDYVIQRRDIDCCESDELGRLSMLYTAFQEEIEKRLNSSTLFRTRLKNEEAQKLREDGMLILGDIEVNFWKNHSFKSVETQSTWNKIKSYTELNSKSDGSSGHIVFTGTMQITREEIADYATKLGFKVHGNISKNTDFVVIGSENVSPTKISKALELNNCGAEIKFLDENTFLSMIASEFKL